MITCSSTVDELKLVCFVFGVCFETILLVCIAVNEDELKRLRLAFKRIAGASGVMGKSLFIREVLGESVPPKLAEVQYKVKLLRSMGKSCRSYFREIL